MKPTVDHVVTELEKLDQTAECTAEMLTVALQDAEAAATAEENTLNAAEALVKEHGFGALQREATMFKEGRINAQTFLDLAAEKMAPAKL